MPTLNVLTRLDKKTRFLLFSFLYGLFLYIFSIRDVFDLSLGMRIALISLFIIGSTLLIHVPNIKLNNFMYSIVLPLLLSIGSVLTFQYYPNFSLYFELLILGSLSVSFYVVLLVDNIFLVVNDREEAIPLYRVAVTWSQILLVIISIPLFSGILKYPENALIQVSYLSISTFIICMYMIWGLDYDTKSRNLSLWGKMAFSLLVVFLVASSGFAVSFFSAESFLRALFISSVLMLGLIYVNGYLKNELNKKLVAQYFFITFIFFIILFFFRT